MQRKLLGWLVFLLATTFADGLLAQCPNLFYDGFESGNWTPTWTAGTGTYTRSVITTAPAVGSYCFTQTGNSAHYQGIYTTFAPATPPSISYWVKTSTTAAANGYTVIGDGSIATNNGIMFGYFLTTGFYRIYSGSLGDFQTPATPNTWIHVELRNINFTNKTYDIWINGVLGQASFPFRSQTSTYIDRIHLYNFSSATAYYDDINVGGLNLSVTASHTNTLCFGDSTGTATATVSTGSPSYSYVWNNGGNTATITDLPAGSVSVTVTDSLGCTGSATTVITSPSAMTSIDTVDHVNCNGDSTGSINLGVSGGTPGYSYLWSSGDVTQNVTGLPASTWIVSITDSNGCLRLDSATVTEPTALVLTPIVTPPSCNGLADGSIVMQVTGGTPSYSYTWNTGATTSSISGIGGGTFTAFVSDFQGCSDGSIIQVTEPAAIVHSAVASPVSCGGALDGSIDVTVSGGSGGFTFLWSNGNTSEDLTGIAGGPYIVTITDSSGCAVTDTILVNEPAAINNSAAILDDTGVNNGSIDLAVSGGMAPYTYAWSNGATTQDIGNLSAGTYTVTITDANGCTSVLTFTVNLVIGIADGQAGPHVTVMPNPSRGWINVRISASAVAGLELRLADLSGRVVYNSVEKDVPLESSRQIDLTALPAGVYLLQVVGESQQVWTKVVKQ